MLSVLPLPRDIDRETYSDFRDFNVFRCPTQSGECVHGSHDVQVAGVVEEKAYGYDTRRLDRDGGIDLALYRQLLCGEASRAP